jgi:hypothetical protein
VIALAERRVYYELMSEMQRSKLANYQAGTKSTHSVVPSWRMRGRLGSKDADRTHLAKECATNPTFCTGPVQNKPLMAQPFLNNCDPNANERQRASGRETATNCTFFTGPAKNVPLMAHSLLCTPSFEGQTRRRNARLFSPVPPTEESVEPVEDVEPGGDREAS